MKHILVLAVSTAFMLSGVALAEDGGQKVEVQSGSATITVIEDGTFKAEKAAESDYSELLDKLPKELREKVKKALQAKQDKEQGKDANITIRGFFVGPDGVKSVLGDPTLPTKKAFEGLPKEVRERIEKAMKEHGKQGKAIRIQAAEAGADVNAEVEIKGVIIGPDGKRREIQFGAPDDLNQKKLLEGLPKDVREQLEKAMKGGNAGMNFSGKAIIIGPDGKKQELDFGNGGAVFGEAFKVIPKKAQEALKAELIAPHMSWTLRGAEPEQRDDVTNKKILEKLEQMQKQINEIRKRLDE